MNRRTLLQTAAAGIANLAAPRIGLAKSQQVLTFIPLADLAILDPIWTAARPTRNHGYLVFDTLYGIDAHFVARPQMVEGHTVENDRMVWTLTLREGLRFHDGEPVRGVDVVASIRRIAARDGFAQALMAATDELSAPSDRVVQFRLKKPFPHLADALAGGTANMPAIMPERLAKTDPFARVTEMVGSGPYRFVGDEHVAGSRAVYSKFDGYVPRSSDRTSFLSGPKVAHFDRVEWTVIPDAATAAAALIAGEADWWELPVNDLLPQIGRNSAVKIDVNDAGSIGIMRFNHLQPPFNNPAIRRALLGAADQAAAMTAVAGTDPRYWADQIGLFGREAILANDAGIEALAAPRDYQKVQRDLAAAGYRGEQVVVLVATDIPVINALSQVGVDELRKAGMNIDAQALDFGTVAQRRTSKAATDKGGWSVYFTYLDGVWTYNPANHLGLASNYPGWPNIPHLEALRARWFDADDLEEQKRICRDLQVQLWQEVPYIPMGETFQPTAYRRDLADVQLGFPLFYGVRRL